MPAYYSDNYGSLLAGESQIINIRYTASTAEGVPALVFAVAICNKSLQASQ